MRVAYVTIDPERDRRARLRDHVQAFHPDFVGLHAAPETTERMARAFRVYNRRIPGKNPGTYTIDHGLFAYAYDRQVRIRLSLPDSLEAGQMAEDLRRLLGSD